MTRASVDGSLYALMARPVGGPKVRADCILGPDYQPIDFHAGQQRAWDSDRRFILVLAGTQGGKTSFGPAWLYREIMKCGPGDYIAATATYDLFKLKMLPELRKFFCDHLDWGVYKAGDKIITNHKGDTNIILRSAQSEGGLESSTAKAAWTDEWGQDVVGVEAQEAIERRLSLNQGRQLNTTTPYNLGWLKQRWHDRWLGGDEDYEVIRFRSIENPAFPVEEYERAQKILPPWKFRMFYDGEFTRPAGLIYGDYVDSYRERGGHLVKPFTIPDTWLRTIGVDFGNVNCARLWIAEDPAGYYYVYRERLGGNKSNAEYAQEVIDYNEPLRLLVGGTTSEQEHRNEWELAGLPMQETAIRDVEAGIDRVTALWRQHRLFVFDTLTGLRSEIATYSRELDDAGEPLDRISHKEKFHRLDALRYAASTMPTRFTGVDDRDDRDESPVEIDPHRVSTFY